MLLSSLAQWLADRGWKYPGLEPELKYIDDVDTFKKFLTEKLSQFCRCHGGSNSCPFDPDGNCEGVS